MRPSRARFMILCLAQRPTISVHALQQPLPPRHDGAAGRRDFLAGSLVLGGVASSWLPVDPAAAAAAAGGLFPRGRRAASYSYVLSPDGNVTDTLTATERALAADPEDLSAEQCLLRLLPVRNPLFRELQDRLEELLGLLPGDAASWRRGAKTIDYCINELDKRRTILEPVFNPEDNSLLQISKAERGERLIEQFRSRLVELLAECNRAAGDGGDALTAPALALQRRALLALSEIGELLVAAYPYQIPTEGKFSYLPRLLGRARVTFAMSRNNRPLGNITVVADGFMAPLTAGNFVDLSLRNFYTQLPVKFAKRRLGRGGAEFDVANLPVLGSYQEGFYDPLTAQLRRLPLELIRVERGSGVPNLAYAPEDENPAAVVGGFLARGGAVREPTANSRPLLSFRIPGLVAMNHPDRNPNGASSEFFALQMSSITEDKRSYLDGEYAPFGFIVDGLDVFEQIKPNDRIEDTFVDEWGALNLVKIRQSSFSEVLGGGEAESS